MGLPPLYLTSGNGLVGLSSHQLIMQVCSEKLFEGRPRVRCAFRQITLTTRCYDTDLPVHAHDHGLRERLHAESVYTLDVTLRERLHAGCDGAGPLLGDCPPCPLNQLAHCA